jgi:hypothetical protein
MDEILEAGRKAGAKSAIAEIVEHAVLQHRQPDREAIRLFGKALLERSRAPEAGADPGSNVALPEIALLLSDLAPNTMLAQAAQISSLIVQGTPELQPTNPPRDPPASLADGDSITKSGHPSLPKSQSS